MVTRITITLTSTGLIAPLLVVAALAGEPELRATLARELGIPAAAYSVSTIGNDPRFSDLHVNLEQLPAAALQAARGNGRDGRAAALRVLDAHRRAFGLRGTGVVERVQGETSAAGEQIVHVVDRIDHRGHTLQFMNGYYKVTVMDGTPAYLQASVLNRDIDLDTLPLAAIKTPAEIRGVVRRWLERDRSLRDNPSFRRHHDDPDAEEEYLTVDPVIYVALLQEHMRDDELLQYRVETWAVEYYVSAISGRIVRRPIQGAGGWDQVVSPPGTVAAPPP